MLCETPQVAERATAAASDETLPTPSQRRWLQRGLNQPGGKLPLFDENGQKVSERTVRVCVAKGWATPWFSNPLKPDWLVCKLTPAGIAAASRNKRMA
jgi:hypothetical protein